MALAKYQQANNAAKRKQYAQSQMFEALRRQYAVNGLFSEDEAYKKGLRWFDELPLPDDLAEHAGSKGLEQMSKIWQMSKSEVPKGAVESDLLWYKALVTARYEAWRLDGIRPEEFGLEMNSWTAQRKMWMLKEEKALVALSKIDLVPLDVIFSVESRNEDGSKVGGATVVDFTSLARKAG